MSVAQFTQQITINIGAPFRVSFSYGGLMKASFCMFIGVIGAAIAAALGGWDTALQTLVIFMTIDYLSGIVVAAVFKKSKKSENGGLDSGIGLKGLFRKLAMLCGVLMAYYLDQIAGTDFVRDATCLAFVCNEAISIIENFGIMGVPMPPAITNAIDALRNSDKDET